jgi:peptide chain release factor 2
LWNDPNAAQKILQEMTALRSQVEQVQRLENQEVDLSGLLDMAVSEGEEGLFTEIQEGIAGLEKTLSNMELSTMLGKEFDRFNTYLTIHPGAGGTESQDWAEMLLRM